MDSTWNEAVQAQLMRLTPSGDLLDLAVQMRDIGVESLLLCRPDGRIQQVVTDRQIAHLATRNGRPDVVPTQKRWPPDLSAPRSHVPVGASADELRDRVAHVSRGSSEGEGVSGQTGRQRDRHR